MISRDVSRLMILADRKVSEDGQDVMLGPSELLHFY